MQESVGTWMTRWSSGHSQDNDSARQTPRSPNEGHAAREGKAPPSRGYSEGADRQQGGRQEGNTLREKHDKGMWTLVKQSELAALAVTTHHTSHSSFSVKLHHSENKVR